MDPEKRSTKKFISNLIRLENVFVGLSVVLGIVVIINIILALNISKELKKNIEEISQKSRHAKIEIVLIKNSKCSGCLEVSTIADYLKSTNSNITKQTTLEFDSQQAMEIISRYNIDRIPTVVVRGEIDKANIQGLERKEDALVLTKLDPPYTNTATGKIEGMVALYLLKDSSCGKCNDMRVLINQIKSAGVKISEEKNIELNSEEGKDLIKRYSLGFVPTIVLSKDAANYDIIGQAWPQIGSKESDGSYVLRVPNPPFVNSTTGALRGVVNVVYLADKSCAECYDVNQHREILASPQSFALKFEEEETLDISDQKGKMLVAKYNITQVPTVILSGEASVYPSSRALGQFFSVENDGSYIFRKISVLGTYKDLAANQVVKAKQTSVEE